MRAALIVIEGLDRSGKSTQAANLVAWLKAQDLSVELIKFPGQHASLQKRSQN
jgi:dTMP kinase